MAFHSLNEEFIRLLDKSGWSQSEAARRLELSSASISMYLSGKAKPSVTVLKLFKLMIGDMAPLPGTIDMSMRDEASGHPALEEWEREFLNDARKLNGADRREVLSYFRGLLRVIHSKQPPVSYKVKKSGEL